MAAKSTRPREIAQLNIEHFGKLLQTPLDDETRKTVEKLLAEEKAKLKQLTEDERPAPPPTDQT
jgi:hypothetical protein